MGRKGNLGGFGPLGMTVAILAIAGAALGQAPDLDAMDLVLRSVPDGPVAKVNGTNIPKQAFIDIYQSQIARITSKRSGRALQDGERVQVALLCIGTLIEEQILSHEVATRNLSLGDGAVEKAWNERVALLQKELSRRRGGDVSEEAIIEDLGFESREAVLADIERILLSSQARTLIVQDSGTTITDEEIAQAYQANKDEFVHRGMMHLRQIFIAAPKNTPGTAQKRRLDARRRIDEALARIQAGQSFEGVARAVSEAPGNEEGGDMGMIPTEQLPPFILDAAAELDPGERSGVLESEYGFHVIKLVEVIYAEQADQEEAAPILRESLLAQKGQKIVREYCDELIENGTIEVFVYLELEKTLSTDPAYRELRLK